MPIRPAIANHLILHLAAALVAAALAILIVPAFAHADEIVLPFTCQMSGGRPALTPSPPQSHRIAGQREERRVTVCSPADPGRCRAWTAYRFGMLCGGVEVAWTAVVANSPPARGGNAWIENGRFRLSMPAAWTLPSENPCSRLIDDHDPGLTRYCASQPAPAQPAFAEMPPGFAPMFGLNGTFTASPPAPAPPSNASSGRPDSLPSATTANGNLNWRASPVATAQPLPSQTLPPQSDPSASGGIPAFKKKPAALPPVAARAEPALKPAIPASRDDAIAPRELRPAETTTKAAPSRAPEPPASAVLPAAINPAAPQIADPAKPEPVKPVAVNVPALARSPVLATPPPPAPSPAAPSTAAAEPVIRSKVADASAIHEPYSSRPVKLPSPDGDLRTGLMIAGSVALTLTLAGAAIVWRRRRPDPDSGARASSASAYGNRGFEPPSLGVSRSNQGSYREDFLLPGFDAAQSPPQSHQTGPAFSEDPFDSDLPSAPGAPDHVHTSNQQACRSSTGHTLSMSPYDGVRTHLDADLPFEDAPVLADYAGTTFENFSTLGRDSAMVETPVVAKSQPSLSGAAHWPTEIPQTHDDALSILGMGVTSRASPAAMKKIVDGLRLSWHPDHATDDADRAIRDLRIRQINTAWDIIAATHALADRDPVI